MARKKSTHAFVVRLSYPDKALSPNAPKRHWRYKLPAKQTAFSEGLYTSQPFQGMFNMFDFLELNLTIFPPDRKKRDLDNVFASMKSAIDGIFKGLGCDDSQVRRVVLEWGAPHENGLILLRLERLR